MSQQDGGIHRGADTVPAHASSGSSSTEGDSLDLVVSMVGHDLRQPLTTLSVCCGRLARDPTLSEGQMRLTQRMIRSVERMERMITHLLDASRVRGDGHSARRTQTSLVDVCREVIDEIEARASDRRFALDVQGDVTGLWDEEQLKRVVANLVDNAVRHGAPGSPIEIHLAADGPVALLEVKNAGLIPREVQERLFRPFATDGVGRRRSGLGLGLYIARELVLAHGGEIRATSAGDETLFRVTLPRAPVTAESVPEPLNLI